MITKLKSTIVALALTLAVCLLFPSAALAQSYQVVHTFSGGGDGATPSAGVVLDTAGNLYGTAREGGSGYGTVYELKRHGTGWTLNPLYTFTGEADGAYPLSRVVFIAGQPGVLYGTTSAGGLGAGVVFRLRPSPNVCHSTICPWTETALYSFSGGTDGSEPTYGDVAFDQTHNMYGTTYVGGAGAGVVWELTPPGSWGTESVLHTFVGGADGANPISGVAFDTAGNLYGTTYDGGPIAGGTVYQLAPNGNGWTENILTTFGCNGNGDYPWAGFIFDQQGNIYGATSDAGPLCPGAGGGTVFELTPPGTWTLNILYNSWSGTVNDNCGPRGTLTMDAAGNLYGTTYCDGTYGYGNVFELSPSNGGWTYTDLYDFCALGPPCSDGGNPISNVSLDTSGNLYGTASIGGSNGGGVVWEITP